MVTVRFTETYDLSTRPNRMSIVGIHTAGRNILKRLYPGFLMQYRKMRFIQHDIVCACASMLPADPQQIGVTAGDIAPEDMFNPILYKTVTNDSLSTLESRLMALGYTSESKDIDGDSALVLREGVTPYNDEFGVYYALLSDRDGFKTANPQAGFQMHGVKPFVFEKLYPMGQPASGTNPSNDTVTLVGKGSSASVNVQNLGFRGNARPMPAIPTTVITGWTNNVPSEDGQNQLMGMLGSLNNSHIETGFVPRVFDSLVIIPPSRLHVLYYRLAITTTVEFFDPRPATDIMTFTGMDSVGDNNTHYQDYSYNSKTMAMAINDPDSSVSVSDGVSLNKIMEGSH